MPLRAHNGEASELGDFSLIWHLVGATQALRAVDPVMDLVRTSSILGFESMTENVARVAYYATAGFESTGGRALAHHLGAEFGRLSGELWESLREESMRALAGER